MNRTPVITDLPNGNLKVHIPMALKRKEGRTLIIAPNAIDGAVQGANSPVQMAIVSAIVRAHAWQDLLDKKLVDSISDLARRIDMDHSFLQRQLRLVYLAPDITLSLLNGEEPPGMSLTKLFTSFPELWEAQREKWGYPDPGIRTGSGSEGANEQRE